MKDLNKVDTQLSSFEKRDAIQQRRFYGVVIDFGPGILTLTGNTKPHKAALSGMGFKWDGRTWRMTGVNSQEKIDEVVGKLDAIISELYTDNSEAVEYYSNQK